MTLGRKILLYDASLLVGLLILASASVWGLFRINRSEHITMEEYQELRFVDSIIVHLDAAGALLQSNSPDTTHALEQIRQASEQTRRLEVLQDASDEGSAGHESRETSTISRTIARLNEVAEDLSANPVADPTKDAALISQIEGEFDRLVQEGDKLVGSTERRSADTLREAVIAVTVTSLIIILIGTMVSARQYRSIMRPLNALREGVRRIASGQFERRLSIRGDREFLDVAEDFNRMAAQLDEMYRNLEAKVAAKSRELVQSERLASVGFLAAGVAHEINNPLGIMSGFAELSLKRLRVSPDAAAIDDAKHSLQIIRDEAFRCREITDRLLTLAKRGGNRGPVSLASVAHDVVRMISIHRHFRGRRVQISTAGDQLVVCGDESELKQVLLNLVANALSAMEDRDGDIRVNVRRDNGTVELAVQDDGCGMSPEIRDHVFEPFFSARRGEQRGIGLGLSITHAIVESHGGTIVAQSDGPGHGSQFTIRLPAMSQEVVSG